MNSLYERYQRQVALPELGQEGQQKFSSAKVLIVGAGGLGCPALVYLVAAGIGTIGIIDDDIVSLNNLHRQVLFSMDDIGSSKAITAKIKLERINPEVKINSNNSRLSTKNALELFEEYDIILDCTDNFPTRYLINDACVLLKKPLVFGAISKFEGQLSVFNVKSDEGMRSTNYRDIFPDPPKENEVKNCAEAGVIGVLPGVIGTLMANEAIKLITGLGKTLINKLLITDLLSYDQRIINIRPVHNSSDLIPQTESEFKEWNYGLVCSTTAHFIIDMNGFLKIKDANTLLVDVRELGETPAITKFDNIRVPLSIIEDNGSEFNEKNIVLFCQSGKRSLQAAELLFKKYGNTKSIYSLQNGIRELL